MHRGWIKTYSWLAFWQRGDLESGREGISGCNRAQTTANGYFVIPNALSQSQPSLSLDHLCVLCFCLCCENRVNETKPLYYPYDFKFWMSEYCQSTGYSIGIRGSLQRLNKYMGPQKGDLHAFLHLNIKLERSCSWPKTQWSLNLEYNSNISMEVWMWRM